ncbi:MAG TPA: 2-oxoglutarate oxidoreductase [Nitrospirae bacterium]|nr:2-oxoglutarate oxidoreductase [Nitrospirota bacterium]
MEKIFSRPKTLKDNPFHYCPGCGHSLIHRLIAENIDKLKIQKKTIGIAPVGCSVFAYNYFNIDMIETAHGRAPAVATAIKRVLPKKIVFSYQGDGDLAAIGCGEIIHCTARAEMITVFFINNATYGMTGGQMAPTTLIGQKTKTTPMGRDVKTSGNPLKMAELIASIDGSSYVVRTSVDSLKNLKITANYIERALWYQIHQKGFSFVEILSPCPTDWNLDPIDSLKWIQNHMTKTFPLGVFKDTWKEQF